MVSAMTVWQEIEKKIRDQTRPSIGKVDELEIKQYRNPPANKVRPRDNTRKGMIYLREIYYSDRGESHQTSATQYKNYAGEKEKSIFNTDDGRILDYGASDYANIHYGIIFRTDTKTDILLRFVTSHPINMYIKYTTAADGIVNVYYTKDSYGNIVGDWFSGTGGIDFFDLPGDTLIKMDIYIYAYNGFDFFRELTGNIGKQAIEFKSPDIIPPSSPTWNDYISTISTASTTTSTTTVYGEDFSEFPWIGPGTIGTDTIQYHGNTATSLTNVSDINSVHGSGTTVYAGAITAAFHGSDMERAGNINVSRPSNWTGIQEKVYLRLAWNNPTTDVEGFSLSDFGGIGVYDVTWDVGDSILSVDGKKFAVSGSHGPSYMVGSSIKVDDQIYTISGFYYDSGYTYVTVNEDPAFTDGVVSYIARFNQIREITSDSETYSIYAGEYISLGEVRYFALDAFDSSSQKNRSDKTSIRKIETGIQSSPPSAKNNVSVTEDEGGISVLIDDSYFNSLVGHSIETMEWFIWGVTRDSGDGNVNVESNYTKVYSGTQRQFFYQASYEDNIFYHISLKLINGAKYSRFEYIGTYQPVKKSFIPDPVNDWGKNNIITSFGDIGNYPYANEVLNGVGAAYNESWGNYSTPIAVIDLDSDSPPNMIDDYEVISARAIYWGDCSITGPFPEYQVTPNTISGSQYGTSFSPVNGLVGHSFIDAAGNDFTIESNTSSTLTITDNGTTPVQGEYGILVNKDTAITKY